MRRAIKPSSPVGRAAPYRGGGVAVSSLAIIAAVWLWRMSTVSVPQSMPSLASELHAVTRDRLIAATVVGMAVGAAGLLLRTATRNPLADPEIVGVNSGAAFGAVTATTLTGSVSGAQLLPGALIGGALAAVITVGVGLRSRTGDPAGSLAVQRMVLLGLAISALFSACTSILLVLDEAQLGTVLSWLSGQLGGVRVSDLVPVIVAVIVVVPGVWVMHRGLDALYAGDTLARAVGAQPGRIRLLAVGAAVALVGPAVAATGPIGFLGLMAAVVSHRIAGPRHKIGLVVAPLVGAAVLLVADTIAQLLWAPAETPVGIVTALAGVPLLLWGITNLNKPARKTPVG